MISYNELTKKTMPPEKRAEASRDIVGHYLLRPISNVISIPLIEKRVNPTTITKISGIFPIISLMAFMCINSIWGFLIGWFGIFIWNILDGVDGNIARYNDLCSKRGELWDATVGWFALICFYLGMGFVAYYNPGVIEEALCIPRVTYLVMSFFSAMSWIFPRLVMQKKNVLFGTDGVKGLKERKKYGPLKLFIFNITSINGLAALNFFILYLLDLNGFCVIVYFLLSLVVAVGSLYTLLK